MTYLPISDELYEVICQLFINLLNNSITKLILILPIATFFSLRKLMYQVMTILISQFPIILATETNQFVTFIYFFEVFKFRNEGETSGEMVTKISLDLKSISITRISFLGLKCNLGCKSRRGQHSEYGSVQLRGGVGWILIGLGSWFP